MEKVDTASEYTSKSLLRYPGGKSRAVKVITPYFPKHITEMVSPFFGGGSIELHMAAKGIFVHGFDAFNPLVEFWQLLREKPCELAQEVRRHHPLSLENFRKLQIGQSSIESMLGRAAAFYALNRSSYSGSTLSGGVSPGHPRFNETSILRVENFFNPNFSAFNEDFQDSLAMHDSLFAYLDPPYLISHALYGKKGSMHKDFDHVRLRNVLDRRSNWVLSYNDTEEVRNLYKGFRVESLEWAYGLTKSRKSNEIVILSHDLRKVVV